MHLPRIDVPTRANVSARTPESVFARWDANIRSADAIGDNVITIYETIGEDWWTGEGFTLKRLDAALRSIGRRDFEVHINSPGGDMFEGVAAYNKIRDHAEAHGLSVKVKVLGIAASAASVIAMAGDEIEVAASASIMIHNCWTIAMGNRNDFAEMSDTMAKFDSAMAGVYGARTGNDAEQIAAWMNAETYFTGQEAIDAGFATDLLAADRVKAEPEPGTQAAQGKAVRAMERALRMSGASAKEAKATISELKSGARDVTPAPAERDVSGEEWAALATALKLKTGGSK